MTADERDSQLSSMYDGELPQAERALVARRLSRDPALRKAWGQYALIGAVMRGESLASAALAPRVAAALERSDRSIAAVDADAASARAQLEAEPRLPRWAVPASGAGLAAGIAVVGVLAVLWLGSQTPQAVTGDSVAAAPAVRSPEVVIPAQPTPREAAESASNGEPLSYVTPPQRSAAPLAAGVGLPFNLASYVGAHSAVSSPMMRHSAIAAIIAEDPAAPSGTSATGEPTERTGIATEAVR